MCIFVSCDCSRSFFPTDYHHLFIITIYWCYHHLLASSCVATVFLFISVSSALLCLCSRMKAEMFLLPAFLLSGWRVKNGVCAVPSLLIFFRWPIFFFCFYGGEIWRRTPGRFLLVGVPEFSLRGSALVLPFLWVVGVNLAAGPRAVFFFSVAGVPEFLRWGSAPPFFLTVT